MSIRIAALAAAGLMACAASAQAATITFLAGTYYLSDAYRSAPTDTLVIGVSGGVASFDLDGSVTWSLPDVVTPDGDAVGGDFAPYFLAGSVTSPSWDTGTYGYLTFWGAVNDGGLTIGAQPGDGGGEGNNLYNLFTSSEGPGQVFAIPEPAVWAMMLTGFAGLGAALRTRRKPAIA
jgi:hypothetical protein